jgi:hypothetical protein
MKLKLKDSIVFRSNVVAKLFENVRRRRHQVAESGRWEPTRNVEGSRRREGEEGGGGPCDRPKTACRCKLFLLRNKWKRALLVEKEMGNVETPPQVRFSLESAVYLCARPSVRWKPTATDPGECDGRQQSEYLMKF